MFKPRQLCIDLMNRLQARKELRQFKYLLNTRATSLAVGLTLSGSLTPARLTSRWLA
jgi:hypothetical protein